MKKQTLGVKKQTFILVVMVFATILTAVLLSTNINPNAMGTHYDQPLPYLLIWVSAGLASVFAYFK